MIIPLPMSASAAGQVDFDRRIPWFDMTQRVLAGLLDLQLSASHRLDHHLWYGTRMLLTV